MRRYNTGRLGAEGSPLTPERLASLRLPNLWTNATLLYAPPRRQPSSECPSGDG